MEQRGNAPASDPDVETGTDLERIIALSDGIFAFAMTLLAVDIRVPDLSIDVLPEQLPLEILGLLPKFVVYANSFFLVGVYWLAHRRIFRYIKRYDTTLLWLSLLYLLFIAFLPVPSGIVGRYYDQQAAVIFFAVVASIVGLLSLSLWLYATQGHRLVAPDLNPHLIRYYTIRSLPHMSMYLLSIALAFVSPYVAILLWLLTAVIYIPLGRLSSTRLMRAAD